jgi:hypothetical protein
MTGQSIKGFREFMKQENEDKCLDDKSSLKIMLKSLFPQKPNWLM